MPQFFVAVEFVEDKGHLFVRNTAIVAGFKQYSAVFLGYRDFDIGFGVLAGCSDAVRVQIYIAVEKILVNVGKSETV